jgi:hypothetical protein
MEHHTVEERLSSVGLPIISRSYRFLPMPLNIAREPWLRFSVLGDDWLPPPRGWDEVVKKEKDAVVRRVRRPDLGWRLEIDARLVDDWTIESRVEVSIGKRIVARLLETESIGGAGYATYVDEALRGESMSGVGRIRWRRLEASLAATIDQEWEHRRHCMIRIAAHDKTGWKRFLGIEEVPDSVAPQREVRPSVG